MRFVPLAQAEWQLGKLLPSTVCHAELIQNATELDLNVFQDCTGLCVQLKKDIEGGQAAPQLHKLLFCITDSGMDDTSIKEVTLMEKRRGNTQGF